MWPNPCAKKPRGSPGASRVPKNCGIQRPPGHCGGLIPRGGVFIYIYVSGTHQPAHPSRLVPRRTLINQVVFDLPMEQMEEILGEFYTGLAPPDTLWQASPPSLLPGLLRIQSFPRTQNSPACPTPTSLTTQAPNPALQATDRDPAANANSGPHGPGRDLDFPAALETSSLTVLCRRRQLLIAGMWERAAHSGREFKDKDG